MSKLRFRQNIMPCDLLQFIYKFNSRRILPAVRFLFAISIFSCPLRCVVGFGRGAKSASCAIFTIAYAKVRTSSRLGSWGYLVPYRQFLKIRGLQKASPSERYHLNSIAGLMIGGRSLRRNNIPARSQILWGILCFEATNRARISLERGYFSEKRTSSRWFDKCVP
jgi:hypothetical protein